MGRFTLKDWFYGLTLATLIASHVYSHKTSIDLIKQLKNTQESVHLNYCIDEAQCDRLNFIQHGYDGYTNRSSGYPKGTSFIYEGHLQGNPRWPIYRPVFSNEQHLLPGIDNPTATRLDQMEGRYVTLLDRVAELEKDTLILSSQVENSSTPKQ